MPLALFAAMAAAAPAQDDPDELPRLVIDHFAGDETPWRAALRWVVILSLLEVPAFVVDTSAGRHALGQMGLEPRTPADSLDQLLRLGRIAEADIVLAARLHRTACDDWTVDVRLIDTATESITHTFEVREPDWTARRDAIVTGVATVLAPGWSGPGRARALRPLGRDPAVLDALAGSIAAAHLDRLPGAVTAALEAALDAEPDNLLVLIELAQAALTDGRLDDADRLLKRARRLAPGHPYAETVTAGLLAERGNTIAAKIRLERASKASPRWAVPLFVWGGVLSMEKRWPEAVEVLERARALEPCWAVVLAALGEARANLHDRSRAIEAIEAAEQLGLEGRGPLSIAVRTYQKLGMRPQATDAATRLVAELRASGRPAAEIEELERLNSIWRRRMVCHRVQGEQPPRMDAEALRAELRARLTPAQLEFVVYPLARDAELDAWAHAVTADIEEPIEKCRALFECVTQRFQVEGRGRARTALQVRDVWDDASSPLSGRERSKLFIAMARACGVEADLVHVELDDLGRATGHDCAAIYDGEDVILVDPSYQWFGAPHREFVILDDLQAIAHQMLQLLDPLDAGARVERARAAVALHTDSPWARARLAFNLIDLGELDEARTELDAVETLDPGRWEVLFGRGMLAALDDDLDRGSRLLDEAAAIRPLEWAVQIGRARVHTLRGESEIALELYRRALELAEGDEPKTTETRTELELAQRRMRQR